MTGARIPDEGPERDIFMRALRAFSDSCRPPELIAECPYSVDVSQGVRGCGEECLEILDKHEAPPRPEHIEFGEGIFASPLRKRQRDFNVSPSGARAFDAAETYMSDSSIGDYRQWRTTSLMVALRENFIPTPEALAKGERVPKCTAICAELDRRGFSADKFMRYGLGHRFVHTLPLAVSVPALMALEAKEFGVDSSVALPESLGRWLVLADILAADNTATGLSAPGSDASPRRLARHRMDATFTSAFINRVAFWVRSTSLENLLSWWAPSPDEFFSYEIDKPGAGIRVVQEEQEWLLDRFTSTYLSDWRYRSLQLEWLYQQSGAEAEYPRRVMRERRFGRDSLAVAVADASSRRDHVNETSSALNSLACRLVESGRVLSALELLEVAVVKDPDNAELLNALGFCLAPTDPDRSMDFLERARGLGYARTVNLCNRLFILYSLGKYAALLEVAEAAIESWKSLDSTRSILWNFESDSPEVMKMACPRCYVKKIACFVAEKHGDESTQRRWRELVATLVVDRSSPAD